MQRALDQLFKDAVNRKPKRLSFDNTTYSHTNIYVWLQKILTDWTIIIPGSSCSEFALSNWPATGLTRNGVKQWLEEKNHQKPDDLIKNLIIKKLTCDHFNAERRFPLKYLNPFTI